MEKEIWKDIPNYEGIYQASNLGRIRTAPNKTTSNKRYGKRVWAVRVLKGRGNNKVEPKYGRPRVEAKSMEIKPKPMAKVKFCGKKTTVSFPDSFCSVECKKGDTYDPEKGVLLCIAKYAGYSYGDIEKMVKQAEYTKEDFAIGDKVVVLPTGAKADDRFAGRIGKILTQDKVWGNQYWVEFEIKKPDGSLLYDIRTMQPAHEQKSIHKDYLLKIKE